MKKYIMFAAMAAVAAVPAFAQDDANTAKPEYLVLTNANGNRVFTGAVEYGKKAITLTSDSIKVQLKGMTTPKRFHKSEVAKISVANAPVADLFDVVWNADGTAKDLGKWNLTVEKKGPEDRIVVNNDNPYGIVSPTFKNGYSIQEKAGTDYEPGTSVGYYKATWADYSDELVATVKSGFSAETIIRIDTDMIEEANDGDAVTATKESKPFSATQSGGFGFSIRPVKEIRNLCFMVAYDNGKDKNGKQSVGYYIAKTGERPKQATYYHMVSVYDPVAATLKLYVNGELKGTIENATKNYYHMGAASRWFGIGADPYNDNPEASFVGQVLVSRVYGNALAENEVKLLFEQANALKK